MADRTSISHIYADVTRAAFLGLVVNLFLGIVKLIGGIVGNSFALIADAVNSIGDVVTTVVVLFALRVAQRPADAEHPYGHTRAEGIAASNVALLVIISAMLVGWEAIQRITVQHDIPSSRHDSAARSQRTAIRLTFLSVESRFQMSVGLFVAVEQLRGVCDNKCSLYHDDGGSVLRCFVQPMRRASSEFASIDSNPKWG